MTPTRKLRSARPKPKRDAFTARATLLAVVLACAGCYLLALVWFEWYPDLPDLGMAELVERLNIEFFATPQAAATQSAGVSTPPAVAVRATPAPQISQPLPPPLGIRTPIPTFTPGATDPQQIFRASNPLLNQAKDEALRIIAYNVFDGDAHHNTPRAHSAGPGYDAPWIRDSFAWGMIPNDTYPYLASYSTSELRYWLPLQNTQGQINSVPLSGYYDESAIIITAAYEAYRITGNKRTLNEQAPALRKAWAWLRTYVNDQQSPRLLDLPVSQGTVASAKPPVAADWADQVARRGYAGQVNLLWYRATQSMALIEAALGNNATAEWYHAFAEGIKVEFNRVLWTTEPPHARNAQPVSSFGHYRSWWPAQRHYFEMDTNLLAILYDVADAAQAESILTFVRDNAIYLLGMEEGTPPPAKTVYGDYDPMDYALIQHKLGDGIYHNAYWLPIGSLTARAFQHAGQPAMAQRTLVGMSNAFKGRLADARDGSAYEWYDVYGKGSGAPAYQWSARAYLNALYRAYLGIEDDWGNGENLRVNPMAGGASGRIKHLGKNITVRTFGEGVYRYAVINGRTEIRTNVIPSALLTDGGTLDLYLGR